jgi:Leucine-rich repeat (LRR) protein
MKTTKLSSTTRRNSSAVGVKPSPSKSDTDKSKTVLKRSSSVSSQSLKQNATVKANTIPVKLSGQQLTGVTEEQLSEWSTIRQLDLSYNIIQSMLFLQDPSDQSKCACPELRTLNLSFNRISKIEGLKGCLQLIELNLQKNKIDKISGLNSLKRLKLLNLQNNCISDSEDNASCFLHNLHLRVLDLGINKLSNMNFLKPLSQLQELSLELNLITSLDTLSADNMKQLQELSLSGNQLTIIPRKYFSEKNFPVLTILRLNENKLSGADIFTDSLPSLTELHLKSNNITSINGIETLFPNLELLDVRANNLDNLEEFCNCVSNLQELLVLRIVENPICNNHFCIMEIVSRVTSLRMLDSKELAPNFQSQLEAEPQFFRGKNIDLSLDMKTLIEKLGVSENLDSEILDFGQLFANIGGDTDSTAEYTHTDNEHKEGLGMIEQFESRKMIAERKVDSAIDRLNDSIMNFKEMFSEESLNKRLNLMNRFAGNNVGSETTAAFIESKSNEVEAEKVEEIPLDYGDQSENTKLKEKYTARPSSARSMSVEALRESMTSPRPQTATGYNNLERLTSVRESISDVIRPKTTANISKRIREAQKFSRQMYIDEGNSNHTVVATDDQIRREVTPDSMTPRAIQQKQHVMQKNLNKVSNIREAVKSYRNPHEYKSTSKLVIKKKKGES